MSSDLQTLKFFYRTDNTSKTCCNWTKKSVQTNTTIWCIIIEQQSLKCMFYVMNLNEKERKLISALQIPWGQTPRTIFITLSW